MITLRSVAAVSSSGRTVTSGTAFSAATGSVCSTVFGFLSGAAATAATAGSAGTDGITCASSGSASAAAAAAGLTAAASAASGTTAISLDGYCSIAVDRTYTFRTASGSAAAAVSTMTGSAASTASAVAADARTGSAAEVNAMAERVSADIGPGGALVACDGGGMWVKRGSPFMIAADSGDRAVLRRRLNLSIEYMTPC